MAPGTIVKANIHPYLDPNIRIEISGMKLLGVKDPTIDGVIPSQSGKFQFKREQGKVSAYLLDDRGETTKLGILNDTAEKHLRSNCLKEPMAGTYRRGIYEGTKNATRLIYLQVTELVEHQPVPKEQITAQENMDDSITIASSPFQYRQITSPAPETYSPNRSELVSWYKASTRDSAERQTIADLGQQLTSTYHAQTPANGRSRPQPDDYHHPDVSIKIEEQQRFDRLSETRTIEPRANSPNIYIPSRADISNWYEAIDRHSPDFQQILAVGQQLKAACMAEDFMQGQADPGKLPDDYQNPSVSISIEDRQRFDLNVINRSAQQSEVQQFAQSR
jgi:hypothetical protein